MKVALCCVFKLENDYLDEWVNHYIQLGFDHLFLIDNNNIDGEHCEDVLSKEQLSYITVIDKRGIKPYLGLQVDIYNEFYNGDYLNEYDWVLFADCDEFLEFTEDKNVHDYLSRNIFDDIDSIRIHWMCFSWGKQYYKTEGTVQERFTQRCDSKQGVDKQYKSFFKTKLPNFEMINGHTSRNENICNNKGEKIPYTPECSFEPINHDLAYIKHYFTKSLEEFIHNKVQRGDINFVNRYKGLFDFFKHNGPFDTDKEYEHFMEIVEEIKKG